MNAHIIRQRLHALKSEEKAAVLQRFFKTGHGEYGEGDVFLGITVPVLRALAKEYNGISLHEVQKLLESPIHEERFLSLLLLMSTFAKSGTTTRHAIYMLYMESIHCVNNWDLVDLSAAQIVGAYLQDKRRTVLRRLATSHNIWKRRISILSTFHFIKQNDFTETLAIARLLLTDTEDLIQKAVGWMLREVGKRDMKTEEDFLRKYYRKMPRTALRYAIERFPEPLRMKYLKGEV